MKPLLAVDAALLVIGIVRAFQIEAPASRTLHGPPTTDMRSLARHFREPRLTWLDARTRLALGETVYHQGHPHLPIREIGGTIKAYDGGRWTDYFVHPLEHELPRYTLIPPITRKETHR